MHVQFMIEVAVVVSVALLAGHDEALVTEAALIAPHYPRSAALVTQKWGLRGGAQWVTQPKGTFAPIRGAVRRGTATVNKGVTVEKTAANLVRRARLSPSQRHRRSQ